MVKNSGQKKSTSNKKRTSNSKSSTYKKTSQKSTSATIKTTANKNSKKSSRRRAKRIDFAKQSPKKSITTKPVEKMVQEPVEQPIDNIVDDVLDDIPESTPSIITKPKLVDPVIAVKAQNPRVVQETTTKTVETVVIKPELKEETKTELDEAISEIVSEEQLKKDDESDDIEELESQLEAKTPRVKPRKRQHKVLKTIGYFLLYILRIALTAALLVFVAAALEWVVQYYYSNNSVDAAWAFYNNKPALFWLSTSVILAVEGIIYGIFRRPFLTAGISFSLITIFLFINSQKFLFRGSPVYPEDFALTDQAGSIASFVNPDEIARIVAITVLSIILGALLDYVLPKWLKPCKKKKISTKLLAFVYSVLTSIAIVYFSGCTLFSTVEYINSLATRDNTTTGRVTIEELDTYVISWNQIENYDVNGFLVGFLYNLNQDSTATPDNYSEETMATIAEKYNSIAAVENTKRTPIEDSEYSFVFVLDESFYDPSIISNYFYDYTGGDVTPNLHRLQQENPSGFMFSTDYGGGTASVEYEILTGFTNYWTKVSSPYQNLISKQKSVPSVASYVKNLAEYNTVGIHAFTGGMYKRNQVFPVLGIDNFIDQYGYKYTDKYGDSTYYNDSSSFHETLDQLQSTPDPQLIHLITMQNHMPYYEHMYGEDLFEVENDLPSYATYLMTLHDSDAALGDFIEQVDALDKKVVVVVYGDHAGGTIPGIVANEDPNIANLSRLTPYFIHTNFEYSNEFVTQANPYTGTMLPTEVRTIPNFISINENLPVDFENNEQAPYSSRVNYEAFHWVMTPNLRLILDNTELPTTTPNCIANTMYNILNLSKPSHFYLLDQICAEQPILNSYYYGESAPEMSELMTEYELVTYDLAAGKQYYLNHK